MTKNEYSEGRSGEIFCRESENFFSPQYDQRSDESHIMGLKLDLKNPARAVRSIRRHFFEPESQKFFFPQNHHLGHRNHQTRSESPKMSTLRAGQTKFFVGRVKNFFIVNIAIEVSRVTF